MINIVLKLYLYSSWYSDNKQRNYKELWVIEVHTHHAAKIKGLKTDGKAVDRYLASSFWKLAYDAHQYGSLVYILQGLYIHKRHKLAIWSNMKEYTQERSHTFVRNVSIHLITKAIWRSIKGYIKERSHTVARNVINYFPRLALWRSITRYTKEKSPTLERNVVRHLVRLVFLNNINEYKQERIPTAVRNKASHTLKNKI